jgi:hypothetical protein
MPKWYGALGGGLGQQQACSGINGVWREREVLWDSSMYFVSWGSNMWDCNQPALTGRKVLSLRGKMALGDAD